MLVLASGGVYLWQGPRLCPWKKDDRNWKGPLAADQAPADHGRWHGLTEGLQEFIPRAKHYSVKTFTTQKAPTHFFPSLCRLLQIFPLQDVVFFHAIQGPATDYLIPM